MKHEDYIFKPISIAPKTATQIDDIVEFKCPGFIASWVKKNLTENRPFAVTEIHQAFAKQLKQK